MDGIYVDDEYVPPERILRPGERPPWEIEAEEREAKILAERGPLGLIDFLLEEERQLLESRPRRMSPSTCQQLDAISHQRINDLLDRRNQL